MKCKPINSLVNGVFFPLTQGQIGVVDFDIWINLIKKHSWHAWRDPSMKYKNVFYARTNIKTNGKWKAFYLHRLITEPGKGFVVDHINGNSLDNRRANLRVCTSQENLLNSHTKKYTNFPGVTWMKNAWFYQWNRKAYGPYSSDLEAFVEYKKIALRNGVRPEFLDESKYINNVTS